MNDVLITNIKSLILPKKTETPLKGKEMDELNIVEDAIVVIKDGKVVYAGAKTDDYEAKETIDAEGKIVSPALVEPHTHIVHGGSREHEMSMKRQGVDYLTILEQGGGILNTVKQTREASFDELLNKASVNMTRMIQHGVLTVESKSGYGLDRENELKQLKVSKALEEKFPVLMRHTFLGPHAIPKGRQAEEFLQEMTDLLDEVKDYADFADIFTETGVFSVEQSRKYMEAAKEKGFRVKIHADEIEDGGTTAFGVRYGCTSTDHLLHVSDEGIEALAFGETVATLLPITAFSLKEKYAPARRLIDKGAAVAIATDCNPGSCFSDSIPLLIALSSLNMGMTFEEIICSLTLNGAAAVGNAESFGSIQEGKYADFLVLKWEDPAFLNYHICGNGVEKVYIGGKMVRENSF